MSADVGEMACIRPQNTPAHCLKTVILYRQMSAHFATFPHRTYSMPYRNF